MDALINTIVVGCGGEWARHADRQTARRATDTERGRTSAIFGSLLWDTNTFLGGSFFFFFDFLLALPVRKLFSVSLDAGGRGLWFTTIQQRSNISPVSVTVAASTLMPAHDLTGYTVRLLTLIEEEEEAEDDDIVHARPRATYV